jgi:glycosyltransferase involved in cell wall biosynthesis
VIGVVIPCFNHWHFLDECLVSLQAQTFTDWRAAIVDDGSAPCAAEADVKRRWTDPRIQWLAHPVSRGPGAARNSGFAALGCEYAATLDADDRIKPEYLSRLSAVLDSEPETDCVFSDFEFFGNGTMVWDFKIQPLGELARWQTLPAQVVMRRSLWERVGGYCEHPALRKGNEDWDFWLAAAAVGFAAAHVAEPLYCYRRAPDSTTRRLAPIDFRTREFLYARHAPFIDRHSSRRRFLADGYWRSAAALRDQHEYLAAGAIALRAFLKDPSPAALLHFTRTLASAAFRNGRSPAEAKT